MAIVRLVAMDRGRLLAVIVGPGFYYRSPTGKYYEAKQGDRLSFDAKAWGEELLHAPLLLLWRRCEGCGVEYPVSFLADRNGFCGQCDSYWRAIARP